MWIRFHVEPNLGSRVEYVQQLEAAREGEQKPFGGLSLFGVAPVGNERPEQQEAPKMSHQILYSLEGCLNNIVAAAKQTAATGGPLAELAASLAVSMDTFARQQIEIKRLTEHINAMRKKGNDSHGWRSRHRGKKLSKLQALCSGGTIGSSPQQQVLLWPTQE